VNGANKKELLDNLDKLDKKSEAIILVPQEVDLKQHIHNRLSQLLSEEEIKWYQISKSLNLLGQAQCIALHRHKSISNV
jgi:Cdc6-like AAA superfamily ATPase